MDQAGWALTLSRSWHTGEYILDTILTPLEIALNKTYLSILLHLQDRNTWKVVILLLQEVKRDIVF